MVRHPVEMTSVNGTNPDEVDDDIIASIMCVGCCKNFLLHPKGDDSIRLRSGVASLLALHYSAVLLEGVMYILYHSKNAKSHYNLSLCVVARMRLVVLCSCTAINSHFFQTPAMTQIGGHHTVKHQYVMSPIANNDGE